MQILIDKKEYDEAISKASTEGSSRQHYSFIEALYNEAMGCEQRWSDKLPDDISDKFWTVVKKLRAKEEKK